MRWLRRHVIIAVCVVVMATAGWVWWVVGLTGDARTSAVTLSGFVVTVTTLSIALATRLWGLGSPNGSVRSVEELTELLATAVRGQWTSAAAERRLLAPAPIPIRWSPAVAAVARPRPAPVGDGGVRPVFSALPGLALATSTETLQSGGGLEDLHALYGSLPSGRLLMVGQPGSGKSAAAVLLVLSALDHRNKMAQSDQLRIPVPVLFTLRGWDASTRPQEWLAKQLVATYSFLAHRRGRVEAEVLIEAGHVALVLDGLDEVTEDRRPDVLEALSSFPLRLVLLTRTAEMVVAARVHQLVDAVAVELDPIPGMVAAEYLERTPSGTILPAGWDRLLERLRRDPTGALAVSLCTPLALTVLRDTYRAGDDVSEVVDLADGASPQATVETHLLARLVDAAYSPRSGQAPPRYTAKKARQALAFLASWMNHYGIRDLAWWDIPLLADPLPRAIATGLMVGLPALLFGAWTDLTHGLSIGLLVALVVGLEVWLPRSSSTIRFRIIGWVIGLVIGTVIGLAIGILAGSWAGLWAGILSFALVTLLVALSFGMASPWWTGLWAGLLVGLAVGLWAGPKAGLWVGLVVGAVAVPTTYFTYTVAVLVNLDNRFGINPAAGWGDEDSIDPRAAWRNNLGVGLMLGLWLWLTLGSTVGLLISLQAGPSVGLKLGLMIGLLVGVLFGVLQRNAWAATLTFVQLNFRRGLPLRLMRFLEDARTRGLIRTVGPLYQFRHAALQDLLAAQFETPAGEDGSEQGTDEETVR